MTQAVLYSKDECQECERARMLLENVNIPYLEYKYQKDFTKKQFLSEFGEDASFPQISIGYNHIGSLKDTLQYLKDKKII
jgi:glutaredoxin